MAIAQSSADSDNQFIQKKPIMHHHLHHQLSDDKAEFKRDVENLVELLSKSNPSAAEFFPSSYADRRSLSSDIVDSCGTHQLGDFQKPIRSTYLYMVFWQQKRNSYNMVTRKLNGRTPRAQKEDSIKKTVYVSEIDQHVTEEQLAELFANCGEVLDCRICGDPHSVLQFAFVEFADEKTARAALSLGGTMLGYHQLKVLPSKTVILPVNPTFLPKSEGEKEMCARTVYCTNIDKKVSQVDIKNFFEMYCGKVSRLRLLGDNMHSTRIAFIEFVLAQSALNALNCSGVILGVRPIRVSPSKTPVRPRVARSPVRYQ